MQVKFIAAARPNFRKVAPLFHALRECKWAEPVPVHTGQYYDRNMSGVFHEELALPEPDHHLGAGSGSHAEQAAGVMAAYEKACIVDRFDWIIVVGDVNPTAACALVGAKMGIRVIHVEAGLRSRDRNMPEGKNRLVTDAIADVLWTPTEDADQNLRNKGVSPDRIDRVGNIMIDSQEMLRPVINAAGSREELKLGSRPYAVVTLHRPSNVDAAEWLMPIVDALVAISECMDIVFAAHPRTVKNLDRFGLNATLFAARRAVACLERRSR